MRDRVLKKSVFSPPSPSIFNKSLIEFSLISISCGPLGLIRYKGPSPRAVKRNRISVEKRLLGSSEGLPPPPPPQNWDPLSQSFFVDPNKFERGMYLTSIDLFFRTKSQSNTAYVTIDIRELDNGFPSPELISYEYTTQGQSQRDWVPYLWAGAGIRKRTSKRSWVSVHVLFDILNNKNSPFDQWEPNVVIGAGTSF